MNSPWVFALQAVSDLVDLPGHSCKYVNILENGGAKW